MDRSGELVTNLSGEAAYQSFKPSPLPPNPELNINSDIVKKLVEANRDLVRLDTAAKLIPNVELLCESLYICDKQIREAAFMQQAFKRNSSGASCGRQRTGKESRRIS